MVVREVEAGARAADVCRRHGRSKSALQRWRAKYRDRACLGVRNDRPRVVGQAQAGERGPAAFANGAPSAALDVLCPRPRPLVPFSPDPRALPGADPRALAGARTGPSRTGPWRGLVGFHAGAGARAALRAGTIGIAALIFAFGSTPDPADTLRTVMRSVVGREAGTGPPPGGRLVYAALAVALSALGARRSAVGAAGWLRSLPASARTVRRAAWAGAVLAALPAAVFGATALALTGWVYRTPLDGAKVAGLPLLLAAAAAVALRVEPPGGRVLALGALFGAAWGTWPTLVLSAGALGAWDRTTGGLAPPPEPSTGGVRRRRPVTHARGAGAWAASGPRGARLAGLALAARWAWRAAGWRPWLDGLAAAALPVAFAAFVRANNADLAPGTRAWVARLGAGLGAAAYVGVGAGALLARRPPWPWVRALPWSAATRVAVDAVVLGAPAAGVGVGAALVLEWLASPLGAALHAPHAATARAVAALAVAVAITGGPALAVAAVAAVAAAGALRAGAGRQTGAAGELALVSVPAAVALALRPALAGGAAAVALALGALAVRRERRAAGAVRWDELRHGIEGDVGWITRV